MCPKELIKQNLVFTDGMIGKYLDGLSDADLLVRPVPGMNHIAWQLGHLVMSTSGMLDGVKPGSSPALPEGFAASYGREAETLASNDPSKFATKETYLSLRKAQREAAYAILDGMSVEDLDAPAPEKLQRMCPTVGSVLQLIANHDLMHAGQFVAVRRSLNKPVAM